jgi:hypothetical protein
LPTVSSVEFAATNVFRPRQTGSGHHVQLPGASLQSKRQQIVRVFEWNFCQDGRNTKWFVSKHVSVVANLNKYSNYDKILDIK